MVSPELSDLGPFRSLYQKDRLLRGWWVASASPPPWGGGRAGKIRREPPYNSEKNRFSPSGERVLTDFR